MDNNKIKEAIKDANLKAIKKYGITKEDMITIIMQEDSEYIMKIITDKEKVKKLGLNNEDITILFESIDMRDIAKMMFSDKMMENYKRKIILPQNMKTGIEIESVGKNSNLIMELTDIIEENWTCQRRAIYKKRSRSSI